MADTTYLDWPFLGDEHRVLQQQLVAWCDGYEFDHSGDIDDICRGLVADLGQAGWLRHCVPAAWGGAADLLDVRSIALCRETLAYYSGLADFALAMQGLGSGPIALFGSAEQRTRYLPKVVSGQAIAAFALSEAAAGSDVAAITTQAQDNGEYYRLDGEKTWISNGGIADFYCVFARSESSPGAQGLSAFVVEADNPGLKVVERIETVAPHPLGRILFDNCRVPKAHRIGPPGGGFKVAMATLDVFRTTVGAAALGFARRALDEAIVHTTSRKLFGAPLAALQMTQARIAEMAMEIDASALLIYRSAWAKDCHQPRVTREAAMAKLYATETAQRVIDSALQLFGASGVVRDSITERLYREIRALRIYEGASEIQKIIIAKQIYDNGGGQ